MLPLRTVWFWFMCAMEKHQYRDHAPFGLDFSHLRIWECKHCGYRRVGVGLPASERRG